MFNPLYSSTNQQLFEKTFTIKVATMEISISIANGSHHMPTFFAVSKDEWDTKEGTGKSMKNGLHV